MTPEFINVSRFLVGFLILLYASYTDIKTRRAPNVLWIIMIISGGLLLLIEYLYTGFDSQVLYLVFIPIMILLMYILFQLRIIFGGADAKALMSLSILVPFWPSHPFTPLSESYLPFPWVVFSNSVLLFLIIPISLLVYNLYKGDIVFPHCLLGYKMRVDEARKSFVWPLEKIVDGKRKLQYTSHIHDNPSQWELFKQQGISTIWVTPKIPFMVPLLSGFTLSFLLGDILFLITRLVT